MFLMLKPGWPGAFRRTVKGHDGQVLGVLEFQPREPVAVEEAEFAGVQADVGKALVFAAETPDGFPTGKADHARTKAFVENTPWPAAAPAAGNDSPGDAAAQSAEPPRGKPPRGKRR